MTLLILCVDRDNDLGEKAGIKGPVIGMRDNIKAANALLLSDPEDSDANSIFAAIKILGEKTSKKSKVAIATITGDKHVGVKSDEELERQLSHVIRRTNAKKVILVSDGVEDESIVPIIQSKLQIVSVHRVIVKQSERLEGMYYMTKNFFKDISKDPKMAKVFLGIPAIVLLLLAIFGVTGWRIVIGALGLYLLIKGFKLEDTVTGVLREFSVSLKKGRISFFLYIVSIIFMLIAITFGYYAIIGTAYDLITSIVSFIYGSVYMFFVAGLTFWAGRLIRFPFHKERAARFLTLLALLFAITIVARSATEMLLKPMDFSPFIVSIVIGFICLSITLAIERQVKEKRIKKR